MEDPDLFWIGSSLQDARAFPDRVKHVVGVALRAAQHGGKHPAAKPLAGFGGAGVLAIVDDDDGDTYRAVYTVRFADAISVRQAIKRKSKQDRATPRADIDLIRQRLKSAEARHERSP